MKKISYLTIFMLAINIASLPGVAIASDRNAKACERLAENENENDISINGKQLLRCSKMAESASVCRGIAVTISHFDYQNKALKACSAKTTNVYDCADTLMSHEELQNETVASCAKKAVTMNECLYVVDAITYIGLRDRVEKYCKNKFE